MTIQVVHTEHVIHDYTSESHSRKRLIFSWLRVAKAATQFPTRSSIEAQVSRANSIAAPSHNVIKDDLAVAVAGRRLTVRTLFISIKAGRCVR